MQLMLVYYVRSTQGNSAKLPSMLRYVRIIEMRMQRME